MVRDGGGVRWGVEVGAWIQSMRVGIARRREGEGVLCWGWGGKGEEVAAEEGGKGEWVWV